MYRFAGFELDEQRAELRGPQGATIRLRPKTFEMLRLFAANPGRVLSKRELMEAVWPDVHVGEDSLFQCIREIRAALGDDRREVIRLASGRGYLFAAEVTTETESSTTRGGVSPVAAATKSGEVPADTAASPVAEAQRFRLRRWMPAIAAVLSVFIGVAITVLILAPDFAFRHASPTVAVSPVIDTSGDPAGSALALAVTEQLIDGLAQIGSIRVVASGTTAASTAASPSDLVVRAELRRGPRSWTLQARIVRPATGEVNAVATASVDSRETDLQLQQSRLAAGVGDPLARQLNTLIEANAAPTADGSTADAGGTRVVIEQAAASINQTSRERFAVAQTMLEGALASEPDNVDLQVALAGLQLRGLQMVWYNATESAEAESRARSLLERALRARPKSIQVLETYCRFLSATNSFVESLVTCAKALALDPWNGTALYLIGLGQVNLGRFDDALATFEAADRFDTPVVSRWTWLLGAGWVCLLMDRDEEALGWLQRSIEVTPASGRSYLLLAAAYQRLGRPDDAKAALAKAMQLRPGSTAVNVWPPTRNTSPIYLGAGERIVRTMIEVGLPEL